MRHPPAHVRTGRAQAPGSGGTAGGGLNAVTGFVHLRLHTEYSLTDGIIRVERPDARKEDEKQRHLEKRFCTLTEQAATLGFPAVAVTDQANLFAMVKFYKAAEAAGIKPLIGADLALEPESETDGVSRITLLVQDLTGYRNLVQLVSRAYTEGQARGEPRIEGAWLKAHAPGLIVLCGPQSDIGRQLLGGHFEAAQRRLDAWRQVFPDRLYLEVHRCGRPDDERHVRAAVQLARLTATPLVATNDVRFLRRDDFEAHEARVCIAQGYTLDNERRPRHYTAEQYLKSAGEMQALFADLPEALENSVEIARRCTLSLKFGDVHLPDFPVPEGHTAASYLREQARAGLERRLSASSHVSGPTSHAAYRQRLDYELDVIEKMGYAGYFLVVADFIAWAKANGVPVGPGRGSGAGSLVAYAVGITDLDPIPYALLFERFLNPERVSLPDFDVDFCMEGRDRVIDYVQARYGRDHVGQIITYGTMAARAVVRDIARVLGHPYGFGDRIAKMIPGGPQGLTLAEALDQVPEFRQACQQEEDVRAVVDLGLQLEGLTRNVGKHAGGVVIAPRPLTDFAPLYCEPGGGGQVTQFDMKDLEAVGLIKFDFLGLKTLTIIQAAVDLINARRPQGEPALDILKIPLDDRPAYELYASGHTTAVFQMESGGMQRASVDLRPDRFEDIIALISLYRPGPMELIPEFVARKRGRKPEYPHPDMEPVLQPTFGIFVYQEQVMQIAQKLAGFTLGGADLLRRAMGKKIASEMAKQREGFVEGCKKNGIAERTASDIFDLMEKFANYGFNKSHAAAYALVSYQTAWLKAHYPAEFMAAVLSCEMNHTDSVVMMIDECRRMGLNVRPPDINRSGFRFEVTAPGEIRYGLGAIKGAGEGALANVLEMRAKDGPFRDLFDLCRRIDTRRTNKRVLEALIGAGALDGFGANRPSLLKTLPKAMALAEQSSSSQGAGQSDMFGLAATAPDGATLMEQEPDWPDTERLRMEKETLGLYYSGHPIESYRALLQQICQGSIKSLIDVRNGPVLLGGWVVDLRRLGKRLLLTLDDRTAQISCILGEEVLGARTPPRKDTLLFVRGRVSPDEFTGGWRIFANELYDLEQVQARFADRILLEWPPDKPLDINALTRCLEPIRKPGGCPVSLNYVNGSALATLDLGAQWHIRVSESGLQPLRQLLGDERVRVNYRRPATPAMAQA
jgi:DNA polymerase III subunit alpha